MAMIGEPQEVVEVELEPSEAPESDPQPSETAPEEAPAESVPAAKSNRIALSEPARVTT